MNFIEELRWRGMLQDIMPGTEDELNKGIVSGYIGFDPTADSLHVGHLTQIMTLIHFQRAGHKPFALVGGATGMVGDPSGKSAERNLLSEDVLKHNVACIESQLKKFLDFECGANSAEMVNNFDWFKNYNFLDFIRDVGKHITVNYMMSKDSVKKRLEGETGMSFTEFSYQLVQGYDFYWLWKNKGCMVQMGGSDQWGNIVTGTELIRRKEGGSAFAVTTKLIKKADGTKFGKTEGGAVWLDAKRTSPYKFYQFWLNTSDSDAKEWIRVFSLKTKAELEAIEAKHEEAPHQRALQRALAEEITARTHSEEALQKAISTSEFLFSTGSVDFLEQLTDDEILEVFEGVQRFAVSKDELQQGINVTDLLAEKTKVFPSKGEARKMIQGGGVSVNRNKVSDPNGLVTADQLVKGEYLIAQKGKKNYFLLIAG
ncbi:tyrosine--tRNA ligase [Pararcticibacter amylolyticus]|uniref:Tyrosine--tRNA ligase n=1 Tax=Pararcticibacter amylolyticus TaxID=2173175 RepID=A0A2U2PFB1_9SPHI|nr:tyrosine--tRNA ligase [Pararcticibacter amylolyticus]PWG79819.1 tyrosine--tRNA ligase [Pararcticibacter amylolyticus]